MGYNITLVTFTSVSALKSLLHDIPSCDTISCNFIYYHKAHVISRLKSKMVNSTVPFPVTRNNFINEDMFGWFLGRCEWNFMRLISKHCFGDREFDFFTWQYFNGNNMLIWIHKLNQSRDWMPNTGTWRQWVNCFSTETNDCEDNKINPDIFSVSATAVKTSQIPVFLKITAQIWRRLWYT